MAEEYKRLDQQWDAYKRDVDRAAGQVDGLVYDGVTVTTKPPPSWRFASALETHLFLLPSEIQWAPVGSLFEALPCPEMPALKEPPRLHCDLSTYPDWYKEKRPDGPSFLDRDLLRRSGILEKARDVRARIKSKHQECAQIHKRVAEDLTNLKKSAAAQTLESLIRLITLSHDRNPLPVFLRLDFSARADDSAGVALVEFQFPDYANVELPLARLKNGKVKNASASQKKKLIRQCLYSLVIRAGVLTARVLEGSALQTIGINVRQSWFDRATGAAREGIVCTLQAGLPDFLALSVNALDPEACFRHLKGIAIPSFDAISPVRPIFVMSKVDDRFVPQKAIDEALEPEANLAAMPWEDFEHLVAQLFEWEFAKEGVEVRVTRASRDRGVDAVLFDPDPLRGGKFVLQAKRYTRTVDVAAVRDLYGTVVNEGANRGILITTSSYGPDAYEFAKDKPISLVDGPNLVRMLQRHGKRYRIDLDEARSLNDEE